MKHLYHHYRNIVRGDPILRAAYVRAGFHDCFPASTYKRNSGCNGSLRFEISKEANIRLIDATNSILRARDDETRCVSYADAFLIAYAAAIREAGGWPIVDCLVDYENPREDSLTGDWADDEETLILPNNFANDFDNLYSRFKERFFTEADMVVSNFVGHSLGGFMRPTGFSGGEKTRLVPFTSNSRTISPLYGVNLLWRSTTTDSRDLDGFHTLHSDLAIMRDQRGLDLLANFVVGGSVEDFEDFRIGTGSTLETEWPREGRLRTAKAFAYFSVVMSQLSGERLIRDNAPDIQAPEDIDDALFRTAWWEQGAREPIANYPSPLTMEETLCPRIVA